MKKIISLLLCLVMVMSLCACGGGGDKETQSGEDFDVTVKEPITIEFWSSYADEVKHNWVANAVEEYNKSQDKVTVVLKQLSGYPAMDEQLSAAQAAGKGLPALAFINCPRVLTYAASGMTEPLDKYIEASKYDTSDFYAGMMKAMVLDADGLTYGLPYGISSSVAFWNMDMLKELGYTTIPETWDELCEAAEKAKAKFDVPGIGLLSELNYVEVLYRNAGADPLGDGTKANLYNEDVVAFTKEYKEMIDKGEAEFFVGSDQNTNITTAFYTGKLLCMINTCSIVTAVDKNCEFEVATSFGIKDKAEPTISCVAGAATIMLAQNSQEVKNAAWDFMMWLLSKEQVASWSTVSDCYPTRKSVMEDEAVISALYAEKPLLEGIFAGLDGITSKNKTPYQTAAYKVLLNAMGQYFYDGADFDTVWKAAESEINNILSGN